MSDSPFYAQEMIDERTEYFCSSGGDLQIAEIGFFIDEFAKLNEPDSWDHLDRDWVGNMSSQVHSTHNTSGQYHASMSSSGCSPSIDTFYSMASSEDRRFITDPTYATHLATNDQEMYSADQWTHDQQPHAQYAPLPRIITPSVIHDQSPLMEPPVSNQQSRPENGYDEFLDFPDDPGYYNDLDAAGNSLYELHPTQLPEAATNWSSQQVEHSPFRQPAVQDQFFPMERGHSYQSTALLSTDSYQDESSNVHRSVQCDACGNSFTGKYSRRNLKRHMQVEHHEDGPSVYYCEVQGCGRMYKRSDALRVHSRRKHPGTVHMVPRPKPG